MVQGEPVAGRKGRRQGATRFGRNPARVAVRVAHVLPRPALGLLIPADKAHFVYGYDFGDDWLHEILVEKILPPEAGRTYPFRLAGRRSAPPEDCRGIWGYEEFLEAISDPNHLEHEEMLEWVGGEFDPEAFDLAAVNQELRQLR